MAQPEQTEEKASDIDDAHAQKMTEVMSAELRALKSKMAQIEEEAKRVSDEKNELLEKYSRAQQDLDVVKEEKKKEYDNVIKKDIKPFLDELRGSATEDPAFAESVDLVESKLNATAQKGIMSRENLADMQLMVQASAATQRYKSELEKANNEHKVTSSRLEELFQADKEWQKRFEAAKESNEMELKKLREENELKEKMLADLSAELKALGAKKEKDIADSNSHFETSTETQQSTSSTTAPPLTEPTAEPMTVEATASSNADSGLGSLISFKKTTDWRRSFA